MLSCISQQEEPPSPISSLIADSKLSQAGPFFFFLCKCIHADPVILLTEYLWPPIPFLYVTMWMSVIYSICNPACLGRCTCASIAVHQVAIIHSGAQMIWEDQVSGNLMNINPANDTALFPTQQYYYLKTNIEIV